MSVQFRIAQCLCPARHAIVAMAVKDDEQDLSNEQVLELLQCAVEEMLNGRGAALELPAAVNPWCGLCGALLSTWMYEITWSRPFANWDDANRALRLSEASNRATATLLALLGQSYNARKP